MGGIWHQPHLVKNLSKPEKPVQWTLNPENVKDVIDGMYGVVNEGGTGGRARLPNCRGLRQDGLGAAGLQRFLKSAGAARAQL